MTTETEDIRHADLEPLALDAARTGDIGTLAPMIAAGVPVNLRDGKGNSLLMLAAYHGYIGTATLLLRSGADPDSRNDREQTPLGGAAFKGRLDVVKLLVEYGADPAAGQGGERLPAHFAALFGHTEIVRYLDSLHATRHRPGLLRFSKVAAVIRGVIRRLGVRRFYIPHAA